MTTRRLALTSLATTFLAAGCGLAPAPETGGEQSQQDPLIAGFRATDPSLNAIGTVGNVDEDGEYAYFCSATLIAPTVVLTARHCAVVMRPPFAGMKRVNAEQVFFAVGPDARKPVKIVEAIATDLSPVERGGIFDEGNDLAVYHLAEPINDVAPVPVAGVSFKATDVGKRFTAVGFGARDAYQDVTKRGPVERRAGYMTLRALTGKAVQGMFPRFEDFLDHIVTVIGAEAASEAVPALRQIWQADLLEGYEAWLGLDSNQQGADGTSDAQACHGDSGGPVMTTGARPAILGVVSAGFGSRQLTCDRGTFYATIGAKTQEMLTQSLKYADPCAKVSTQGACDGTVARRCTAKFEGDRRVTSIDCADLGMVCRPGGDGVVACMGKDQPAETAAPVTPATPVAAPAATP